jgi:hypothetical protein
MNPFEKPNAQALELRFLDDREWDPHRVRFWRVRVSLDGLWIQPDLEACPPDAGTARWHEVFDLLVSRPALLEERDEVEAELRSLRHDVERERHRLARLRRVIAGREAQLENAEQLLKGGTLRLVRAMEELT